ncbi:MAG: hypothetical protein ACR2LQ_04515 [Acidimicrobiales bacterium]
MASSAPTNRGAPAALILAMVVLVAGIVAALTYDDGKKSATVLPTPTTAPSVVTTTTARSSTTSSSTSTTSVGTSTTVKTPGGSTTTLVAPPTTAEPAVPSPEQAATGLFAAYRSGDRGQAERFATDDVISVLFEAPYSPPDGSFQGCQADGELFQCRYAQGQSTYDMTAQRNPSTGSFLIVVISVTRPSTPTTQITGTSSLS